ncbi:MAG TPA: hypothetical protein VGJ09_02635 [Bryobacteraceae bacterium]
MRSNALGVAAADRRVWQQAAWIIAALFAIFWAILRACTQSLTVDETDTYLWFVAKSASRVWEPFPNNHLLNSLLMWVFTHSFGPSSLTLRLPALCGAALYIAISYFLSRGITDRFSLQFPVFICLVYNPFILDFMSAARGYSLANAFLLAAIAIPVWHRQPSGPSLRRSCTLASLALALSFLAVFAFAFVDLAVFFALAVWAIRRRGDDSIVRILLHCALPGLLLALVAAGYPLAHWPSKELWYGAHSLREMKNGLIEASLHQLNPRFGDARWYRAIYRLKPLLLPVLALFCVCRVAVAGLDGSYNRDVRARWLVKFAAALSAILAFTLLLHWLAFRFNGLPLPKTRTGIFLLPLCTLLAAVIAASPARSRISQWLRRGTTAAIFCLACYFLLCLRVSYFEEYQFDADLKDVYSVLARLNHTYGINDVAAHALYYSPLEFYRVRSNRETFTEFLDVDALPSGRSAYVLRWPYYHAFVDSEKLRIIYHGKSTDVVVAVRSDDSRLPAVIEP